MPKISIIVPVYKAQAVLGICVDSVLKQSFSDWELLLIDDGSPDESGALCDQFAAQDGRIRAIHKENGGVSTARNLGMALAQGDYIAFSDSDDWLEPNALEALLTALEEAGADSAGCGHWNIQPSGDKVLEPAALPPGIYGESEIRTGIVDRLLGQRLGQPGQVLNGFIWRFLFSRSIIADHQITFDGAYLEDELFLMAYFCRSKKLAMIADPLYFYLQNPNSVTRNYLPNYMETFGRFMAQKTALVAQFGLDGDDPQWADSSNWAGLLIAIGNEYAKSNPATTAEKQARVKAFTQVPAMRQAIANLNPQGMGRNKQLVANLVRWKQFGLLTLLYQIKNR